MGKGKDGAHSKSTAAARETDVVQFDYGFFSVEKDRPQDPNRRTAYLVGYDCDSGATFATQVRKKGASDAYAMAAASAFCLSLGATSLTIQTDGEPAIIEFGQTLAGKLRIKSKHRV